MSLLTAAAFAVAGCAASPATGGGTQDTPTRDALSAGTTGPATELVRVTGTVVTGEQPGCVLLETGFTTYLLLGGDRAAIDDAAANEDEATVTGQAGAPTPATTCTEGTPLAIQKFAPAT